MHLNDNVGGLFLYIENKIDSLNFSWIRHLKFIIFIMYMLYN